MLFEGLEGDDLNDEDEQALKLELERKKTFLDFIVIDPQKS